MTDSSPPDSKPAELGATSDPWAAPGGLAWIAIAAVAWADQLTKFWVLRSIAPLPDPRGLEVFRNLLYFHYKENTGVAFSLFEGHPEILSIITTVAIGVIGWWAWSVPRRDRLMRFAFGLVLGGAIGNLIDRWVRGFVVDFIDVIIPGPPGRWHEALAGSRHFATFNVADSAICVGMGLLILTLFLGEKRRAVDTVTR